jgi:hypothetical protein
VLQSNGRLRHTSERVNVLGDGSAEAGTDLARPEPHVAKLADRRLAVDAVRAGYQAAQVGDHDVPSRDVIGTEGELGPA